jgi:hypothetical protein
MQTLAIIGSGISGLARLDQGIPACQTPAPLSLFSLGGTAAGQHLFQKFFG